jgi:hypothetical protein
MLGSALSSQVGVSAVQGFVGGFSSSALAGDKISVALKQGTTGALLTGALSGITGGSAAFKAGSYTGPTTISGQWERLMGTTPASAITPSPPATGIDGFGAAADQVGGAGFGGYTSNVTGIDGFGAAADQVGGAGFPQIVPEGMPITQPYLTGATAPVETPVSAATAPVTAPLSSVTAPSNLPANYTPEGIPVGF